MPPTALTTQRLHVHGIAAPAAATPLAVVRALGAIQAQDYHASLWAVGLRMADATVADVEQAIARGEIVRTWPMRGTLHLLAREDVRWMLALMAARVQAANAARIQRDYGLDDKTLARCTHAVERALSAGTPVTRTELYRRLDDAGIDSSGQRGLHVLGWLAQEGLVCQGPRAGKQPTFVWMDAWVPATPALAREEALHRLALRYLHGHGPATAHDLAWWSGLTLKDANAALSLAAPQLVRETFDDATWWRRADAGPPTPSDAIHLLPAFDEYVIGYRHRDAILDPQHLRRVIGINGLVSASVVTGGRVAAIWKRDVGADGVTLALSPLRPLKSAEKPMIRAATQRYGRFLGLPVRIA